MAALTLYTPTFGPITVKENGIEYLYAWLNKHPDDGLIVYIAKFHIFLLRLQSFLLLPDTRMIKISSGVPSVVMK